jgi:hypothetical protein
MLRNLFTKKSRKYYTSLSELPYYRWRKAIKGDFQFCRIEDADTFNIEDVNVFKKLYNEYLELFGADADFDKVFNIKIKLVKLIDRYIQTNDKSLLTFIEIEKINLKQIEDEKNAQPKTNEDKILIHLSKWLGFSVMDDKKMTVVQFMNLVEEYNNQNKTNKNE